MEECERNTAQPLGGAVMPYQCCACYTARRSITLPSRECWYCRYADFHLCEPVALEVGICRYPKKQTD